MVKKKEEVEDKKMWDLLGQVDLVFAVDVTGSMGPFIESAKKDAKRQAEEVAASGDLDIRYAIIAYRDHPPQEHSFVTQKYGFFDASDFQNSIDSLYPSGGGDAPEAVYDGLMVAAKELKWRPNSDKLVFLIGDAPPHSPCLCKLTSKNVIDAFHENGIKLHAFSIAGHPDTNRMFNELTGPLGGMTRVGEAREATKFTGETLYASSASIGHSRSIAAYAASGVDLSSMSHSEASASIASHTGLSEEEVDGTLRYMSERGIDPLAKKKTKDFFEKH